MDTRRARPEELDELPLDHLRDLDLEVAEGAEAPSHVASASGIARRGRNVYVIGDESDSLAVFDLTSREPGRLHRVLAAAPAGERGDTPKPDLEALTVLPPGDASPYGVLLGVGSGSGAARDRGFAWDIDASGGLRGEPRELDLAPLYDLLRTEIGGLNLEGAAVLGDELLLFHRGNDSAAPNAIAHLDVSGALESMRGDREIDAGGLNELRTYELGSLEDVDLCFSDATPLDERLVVFTASAEDADGAIRGSVIGVLGPDGDIRRLRRIDRRWKVEGVHATTDTGVLDLLFVCDQDDPDTPSPLLGASMPIASGFGA